MNVLHVQNSYSFCTSAKVAYFGTEYENFKLDNICDSKDPKTALPYKGLNDKTAKPQ